MHKNRQKEKKFLLELLKKNRQRLVSTAIAVLHSQNKEDIEDCLQELCLTAQENIEKLMAHPCPDGWLIRTVSNIAHDMRRETEKKRAYLISYDEGGDSISEESFESELIERMDSEKYDLQAEKERVFAALSARELDIYNMRFIEKREYSEIAKKYNTSVGCIRAWVSQLRKHVKEIIDQGGSK